MSFFNVWFILWLFLFWYNYASKKTFRKYSYMLLYYDLDLEELYNETGNTNIIIIIVHLFVP